MKAGGLDTLRSQHQTLCGAPASSMPSECLRSPTQQHFSSCLLDGATQHHSIAHKFPHILEIQEAFHATGTCAQYKEAFLINTGQSDKQEHCAEHASSLLTAMLLLNTHALQPCFGEPRKCHVPGRQGEDESGQQSQKRHALCVYDAHGQQPLAQCGMSDGVWGAGQPDGLVALRAGVQLDEGCVVSVLNVLAEDLPAWACAAVACCRAMPRHRARHVHWRPPAWPRQLLLLLLQGHRVRSGAPSSSCTAETADSYNLALRARRSCQGMR